MIFRYLYPVYIKKGICLDIKGDNYIIADNDHQALWLDRNMMVSEIGNNIANRIMDILSNHMIYNSTTSIISLLGAHITYTNLPSPLTKLYIDRNRDRYFLCDGKTILVTKDRIEYTSERGNVIYLPYFILSFWGLHFYERLHIITVPYCATFIIQSDGQIYYPKNNMDMIYLEWDKIDITISTRVIDSIDDRYPVVYSTYQGYIKVYNIKDEDCILCTEKNHGKYVPCIDRCRSFRYNGYLVSITKKGISLVKVMPESIYDKQTPFFSDITIEHLL